MKVVETFFDRQCFNEAFENRPGRDLVYEVVFGLAASLVFSKRAIANTLLKRKENNDNSAVGSQLMAHIQSSERDVYRHKTSTDEQINKLTTSREESASSRTTSSITAHLPRGSWKGKRGNRRWRGDSSTKPTTGSSGAAQGYYTPLATRLQRPRTTWIQPRAQRTWSPTNIRILPWRLHF
jgi:hypothetical protein